jgi:hypothetical protein
MIRIKCALLGVPLLLPAAAAVSKPRQGVGLAQYAPQNAPTPAPGR